MRAVAVEELGHLPFVRHSVDPALLVGAWRGEDGSAVVLAGRPTRDGVQVVASALGTPTGLAPLLAHVADTEPLPARLLLSADAAGAVPPSWRWAPGPRWRWMLTRPSVAVSPPDAGVETVAHDPAGAAAVEELLDAEAPGSFARPGTPGVEAWLGVREGGRLVAAGAVLRQPDGSGHLRAVTVASAARGRGLGRRLSAALTRRALDGPGISSLGVYVDNLPALRIYGDLGYEPVHTLLGGPLLR